MKKEIYEATGPDAQAAPQGPHRKKPVRVSLAVYLVSLILVFLLVFVVMLVTYLPGHRQAYKLSKTIENSGVTMKVLIPNKEAGRRKDNPFNSDYVKSISDLLKDMGATSARVEITPRGQ